MESTRAWLDGLYAQGRPIFTFEEVRRTRSVSGTAMRSTLARAQRAHLLFSPARGLYVIVPPEYRGDGVPPWRWYLERMMRHLGASYYVGLLSAAAQFGASPQSAQETQVIVDRQVHSRTAGRGRLVFVHSSRAAKAPTLEVTTPTGRIRFSTPEMTMLDLVAHPARAAGWGNVASLLPDLARQGTRRGWAAALRVEPATLQVQRLGYLLDRIGAPHTDVLADWLSQRRPTTTTLVPGGTRTGPADPRWRVIGDPSIQPD